MKFLRSLLEATKPEKSPISGKDVSEYSRQVDHSFKGDKNHKAGKTKRDAYANAAMDCIDNCPKHGNAEEHHKSAAAAAMWNKYMTLARRVNEALDDSAFNSGDAAQEKTGTTDIQDNPHALAVWVKSGRQIARLTDYPNTSEGYKSFMKDLVDKFVVSTGDDADHRDYKQAKDCIQEYSNIHPKELKQASSTDLEEFKEVPVKPMDMDSLHGLISDLMNVRDSNEDIPDTSDQRVTDDNKNTGFDPNKAGQSMRNQGDGGFTESTTGAGMKYKALQALMAEADNMGGKLTLFICGGNEIVQLDGYSADETGFAQFKQDLAAKLGADQAGVIDGEFGIRFATPELIQQAREHDAIMYRGTLDMVAAKVKDFAQNDMSNEPSEADMYGESVKIKAEIARLTDQLAKLEEGWDEDSEEDRDVKIADAYAKKDKKALSPRAEAAIAKKVGKMDKKAEDKATKVVSKAKEEEEEEGGGSSAELDESAKPIKGSFAKFLESK